MPLWYDRARRSRVHRIRWLVVAIGLAACTSDSVVVQVVDEGGNPVLSAVAQVDGDELEANGKGEIRLPNLTRPVAMLIEASGYLSEPVTVGASDLGERVEVELLHDGDGRRTVIHFTGDVMIGRRYQEPLAGDPLVPAGDPAAARALVSDAAPWLSAADVTVVNLESVVGERPVEEAYPGKRWLLQTPPDALAALDELGVDLTVLANNHQRDWLDDGVATSLDHIDAFALPRVGAGLTEEQAGIGHIVVAPNGTRVGVLAWTSVDGDYVNDAYPPDDVLVPYGIEEQELWQWEPRSWGAPELGVETAPRRVGGAWSLITDLEPGLSPEDTAALWASAVAVYPELQDWVARRGHAGAARWSDTESVAAIEELRSQVDVLVVQLHMGYQFAPVPGTGTRDAARAAVDAGADIVVCHHPHVLQGVEWYQDRLIAYSLGNFVFDQDFLSTFRSAFLRTVWEDGVLIQARIVPLFLDGYRPVPAADALADGTLRSLWEGSLLAATARRGNDLGVRPVVDTSVDGAVTFRLDHHTAVLERGLPSEQAIELKVPCDGVVEVPRDLLIRMPLEEAGYLVGRELDLLGRFEDQDADRSSGETVGWTWSSDDIEVVGGAFARDHALGLIRSHASTDRLSARMLARVPLPQHRRWRDAGGFEAADGVASYSVRLFADRVGVDADATVRLALYHFDDLNPTEDPESVLLNEVELHADVHHGKREILLDVPSEAFVPVDGLVPNAALPYATLYPPDHGDTMVRLWDFSVVEWRAGTEESEGYAAIDWIRGASGACGTVEVQALQL
jgi:poly-gamma-glutamate capsule biosynthesis protein CapA/YwtB (metallophosphatase superfamily)